MDEECNDGKIGNPDNMLQSGNHDIMLQSGNHDKLDSLDRDDVENTSDEETTSNSNTESDSKVTVYLINICLWHFRRTANKSLRVHLSILYII